MTLFIVRRAWVVDAADDTTAAAISHGQNPTFTRIRQVPARAGYGPMKWYTQPQHVLDQAWDAYHEREIEDPPFPSEPDPFPRAMDLSLKGVELPQISMIMDVAISSYREAWPRP